MTRRDSRRRAAARARLRARQGPPSWFLKAEIGWSAYRSVPLVGVDVLLAAPPHLEVPELDARELLLGLGRYALAHLADPPARRLSSQRTEGVEGVPDGTLVTTLTHHHGLVVATSGEVARVLPVLRALVDDLEARVVRPTRGLESHAEEAGVP